MPAESLTTPPRVQAICAAVGPYAWRSLTADMVARRLLAAVDRLLVLEVIGAADVVNAPELAVVEAVDRNDERLEPLLHLMASFRWRDVTLTRLVQLLLEALDQWWSRRDAFEDEVALLLDEQR